MKRISDLQINLFGEVGTERITNERQLVIKDFLDKLNSDRKNFKPLKAGFVGMKMSAMNTRELKEFYNDCCKAKNFSKYWWWALK